MDLLDRRLPRAFFGDTEYISRTDISLSTEFARSNLMKADYLPDEPAGFC